MHDLTNTALMETLLANSNATEGELEVVSRLQAAIDEIDELVGELRRTRAQRVQDGDDPGR